MYNSTANFTIFHFGCFSLATLYPTTNGCGKTTLQSLGQKIGDYAIIGSKILNLVFSFKYLSNILFYFNYYFVLLLCLIYFYKM